MNTVSTLRPVRSACQRANRLSASLAALLAAALALLAPAALLAQQVFINEVDVTGTDLRNQHFTQVDEVWFDADGNIHVTAPAYTIQVGGRTSGGSGNVTGQSRPVTESFFLVSVMPPDGTVPYRITVRINGVQVATIDSTGDQVFRDVTQYLQTGQNRIEVDATRVSGGQSSGRATDVFRVIVGAGETRSGAVELTRTVATVQRTGADTATSEHFEYTFAIEP